MHVAAARRFGLHVLLTFGGQLGLGRGRQISRPAQQALHLGGDGVQHLARGVARGDPLGVGFEIGQVLVPAIGQMAAAQTIQFVRQVGIIV